MSRPARRALVASVAIALVAGTAWASSGSFNDSDDTIGPLDVKQARHSDTATEVTYEIEMFEQFAITDVDDVTWGVDGNGDGEADGCVEAFFDEGKLSAEIVDEECAGDAIGTATVSQPSPRVLRVVFPRAVLTTLGVKGSSYGYDIEASHVEGTMLRQDEVPDGLNAGIRHTLGTGGGSGTTSPATPRTTIAPLAGATPAPAGATPRAGSTSSGTTTQPAGVTGGLPGNGGRIARDTLIAVTLILTGQILAQAAARARRSNGPVWERRP